MKNAQQDMMCVLLKTLWDKNLIPEEVHNKAREKILDTLDWPEFFCYAGADRKEENNGSA